MAATAACAFSPMQSSANATGRFTACDTAATIGFSESFGSGPLGRPKCASRMTLPPLSAISVMVGATRSMRVASVTLPFSIGTLRSTRSRTRLSFTSASSRVLKFAMSQPRVPGERSETRDPGLLMLRPTGRPGSAVHRFVLHRVRDKKEYQISLPIATAVSAMRLEKPHSLSYQDITRTKVPSMTLVWSMWKIDECGSWLKSIETFGSLV